MAFALRKLLWPRLWPRGPGLADFRRGRQLVLVEDAKKSISDDLTEQDKRLMQAYRSGTLRAVKLEANEAWGHGEGTDIPTIDKLASLEHQIKEYWRH